VIGAGAIVRGDPAVVVGQRWGEHHHRFSAHPGVPMICTRLAVLTAGPPPAHPAHGSTRSRSVIPRMPCWFRCTILDLVLGLATVSVRLDRQGWITVFAAILLGL